MTPLQLLARRAQSLQGPDMEILSPCVSVCRMSPATALCEGCFRTLSEIADWSRADGAVKRAVWARVEARAAGAWAAAV